MKLKILQTEEGATIAGILRIKNMEKPIAKALRSHLNLKYKPKIQINNLENEAVPTKIEVFTSNGTPTDLNLFINRFNYLPMTIAAFYFILTIIGVYGVIQGYTNHTL